jgi:chromosome segregation ATPase
VINNELLLQYVSLTKEIEDIKSRIKKLDREIVELQEKIMDIENDYIVKDKVYGGNGGKQGFVSSGVSQNRIRECENKKTKLFQEKLLVEEHRQILQDREIMVKGQINEIEKFLSSISDSFVRRIVMLRVIDRLTWNEVADEIGGGNTENSVKKIYQRCLNKG